MAQNRSRTHVPPAQRHADQPDAADVLAADVPADSEAGIAGEGQVDPTQGGTAATTGDGTTGAQADGSPASSSAPASDSETAEKPKRKYERKVIKEVPVDELGDEEDVPEEEWEQTPLVAAAVADRSDAQKVIDAKFAELLKKWNEVGQPEPRKSPRSRRVVSPEHAPAIRNMIASAAKLHDVGYKFSPAAFDQNGREVIVYSPAKKIVRPRRGKSGQVSEPVTPGAVEANAAESVPSASDGSLPGE